VQKKNKVRRPQPKASRMDVGRVVDRAFSESLRVKRTAWRRCRGSLLRAGALLADCLGSGGKILLCGNGGSAADCQHFAGEMINYLSKENPRGPLPAIALTADSSVMTSIANDSTFARVFARQVEGLGRPGDVLIGISTSGGSRNVVQAVRAARRMGMKVVVLTGSGGVLARMADCALQVPSANTQRIQETHLLLEHLLCLLSERNLT
jgi:D-sedoheptulose 7-phosphate isomerase